MYESDFPSTYSKSGTEYSIGREEFLDPPGRSVLLGFPPLETFAMAFV
jgi:hypothetical protein